MLPRAFFAPLMTPAWCCGSSREGAAAGSRRPEPAVVLSATRASSLGSSSASKLDQSRTPLRLGLTVRLHPFRVAPLLGLLLPTLPEGMGFYGAVVGLLLFRMASILVCLQNPLAK